MLSMLAHCFSISGCSSNSGLRTEGGGLIVLAGLVALVGMTGPRAVVGQQSTARTFEPVGAGLSGAALGSSDWVDHGEDDAPDSGGTATVSSNVTAEIHASKNSSPSLSNPSPPNLSEGDESSSSAEISSMSRGGGDQVVYSEDFSSEPQYEVLYQNVDEETEVYWDESNENYYAKVRDQTSDTWWAIGKSPEFTTVSSGGPFTVTFKFNPVEPDWGHYPGISFVESNPSSNPRELSRSFVFEIKDSDNYDRELNITNTQGNRYSTPTIPSENEWYEVKIEYDPESETIDLSILREDGSTFVDETGISVPIYNSFNQVLIGETQGDGIQYGDQAQIRVDDIVVNAGPDGGGESPEPPTDLQATAGDGQVDLTWNPGGSSSPAGYNVYRSTSSFSDISNATKLNGSLLSDANYTDREVTNGTEYFYRVTGVDSDGNESSPSGEVSTAPREADVEEGLIAYYPFNGDAEDATGNGNDGTVNGATLTADRSGNAESAYNFDGDDDYIDLPDDAVNTSAGSVCAWFLARSKTEGSNDRVFSMSYFASPGGTRLYLSLASNQEFRAAFIDDQLGDVPITYGAWQHTCFTWNSDSSELYLNGTLEDISSGGEPTNGRVNLGSYGEGFKHFLDGKIDQVRVHNRPLTEEEVQQLYGGDNGGLEAPTDLQATAGDGQVDLTWNPGGDNDPAGYNVYRSTSSFSDISNATKLNGSLVSSTSYPDIEVTNGTEYFYRVTAVDDDGNESAPSEEASVTLPSSGTTVIVHGSNLVPVEGESGIDGFDLADDGLVGENPDQKWVKLMSEQIKKEVGGEIFLLKDGEITEVKEGDPEGEKILMFDWLEESVYPVFGYAEGAADALVALLFRGVQERDLDLSQLHVVGHSRGAIVASEAIQRLSLLSSTGEAPVPVDDQIHFTPLDPHPWDAIKEFDSPADRATALLNAHDQDVNSSLGGVVCWENVGFADHHWQQQGFFEKFSANLSGLSNVPGCDYSRSLNEESYNDGEVNHGNMPYWYKDTIDDNINISGGLEYARSIRESDPSVIGASSSIAAEEDNTLETSAVFNGNFNITRERPIDHISTIEEAILDIGAPWASSLAEAIASLKYEGPDVSPGWRFHGGNGGLIGNPCTLGIEDIVKTTYCSLNPLDQKLVLNNESNQGSHNIQYVPSSVTTLHFSTFTFNTSSSDRLKVYFKQPSEPKQEVADLGLSEQNYLWSTKRSVDLPNSIPGTSGSFEFVLESEEGAIESSVGIDDVGFEENRRYLASVSPSGNTSDESTTNEERATLQSEASVFLGAYDESGNYTGPTSDTSWVAEIPGSKFLIGGTTVTEGRHALLLPELPDGEEYTFEVVSQGETEAVDLLIEDQASSEQAGAVAFGDVGFEPNTTISTTISGSTSEPTLEIDEDGDGTTEDTRAPSASGGTFRPSNLDVSIQRTFDDASGPSDYRLVALPGEADRSLSQAVSGEGGTTWEAFWDDGSEKDFLVEHDGSNIFRFRPGQGFWLTSRQEWTLADSVESVPLENGENASIQLHEGWNIISNPLGKDVNWNQVEAANGDSLRAIWRFDGTFAQADTFRSAKTGEAFYFLNDTGLDSLSVPYPSNPSTRAKQHEESSLLAISARPEGSEIPASTVKVGFDEKAAESLDRLDQPAPPGRFSAVSLRLETPGKGPSRQRWLAAERRPPSAGANGGQTFDLRLRSQVEGPVRINASGLEAAEGPEVELLHPSTGRSYDLKSGEPVTLQETDSTALRLAVGTDAYVQNQADKVIPDEVTLTSYPNPVRKQATLEYTLPEAKEVRLTVYDVLGRRVATLEQGEKRAGRHQVRLQRRQLSSGVYFGRLRVGEKTRTQKITVVR
jgi:hypothetical protein